MGKTGEAKAGSTLAREVGSLVLLGALALVLGALVGFGVWALLSAAYWLIELVWGVLAPQTGWWFFPLVACTAGGALIAWWSARFHSAPKPLDQVMAEVKSTGGYSVGRLAPASIAFLLPIAFGGSVGPEAGLTGLIASGCTWVGTRLRRAAYQLGALPSADAALTQSRKFVLYPLGVAGGIGGAVAFSALFGGGMAVPRFGALVWNVESLGWTVPLALVGCGLALLYVAATRAAHWIAERLAGHPMLRPVLCGVALGFSALFLPYVLFPGSQQAVELVGAWEGMSPTILLLTGLIKTVFVAFCLNMGWNGGPFFPLLFCGASFGFGVSGLLGIDPLLCVTVVTTSLIAGFSRKPMIALLLAVMCFPLSNLPWVVAAAAVGAFIPLPGMPKATLGFRSS